MLSESGETFPARRRHVSMMLISDQVVVDFVHRAKLVVTILGSKKVREFTLKLRRCISDEFIPILIVFCYRMLVRLRRQMHLIPILILALLLAVRAVVSQLAKRSRRHLSNQWEIRANGVLGF